MASGDTIAMIPPATGYSERTATMAPIAFTPAGDLGVQTLRFTGTVNTSAVYCAVLSRQYGGKGFNVVLAWKSPGSGTVKWKVSLSRLAAGTDLSAGPIWTTEQAASGTIGAPNALAYTTVPIPPAQMGGIASGELFQLRVVRDVSVVGNAAADAYLVGLVVKEQ
jgi:hypothetical protein